MIEFREQGPARTGPGLLEYVRMKAARLQEQGSTADIFHALCLLQQAAPRLPERRALQDRLLRVGARATAGGGGKVGLLRRPQRPWSMPCCSCIDRSAGASTWKKPSNCSGGTTALSWTPAMWGDSLFFGRSGPLLMALQLFALSGEAALAGNHRSLQLQDRKAGDRH